MLQALQLALYSPFASHTLNMLVEILSLTSVPNIYTGDISNLQLVGENFELTFMYVVMDIFS